MTASGESPTDSLCTRGEITCPSSWKMPTISAATIKACCQPSLTSAISVAGTKATNEPKYGMMLKSAAARADQHRVAHVRREQDDRDQAADDRADDQLTAR